MVHELTFPSDFLWGAATAAHQVEGQNTNSDWWDWELRPRSPCREPSGDAADHYHRYRSDIALLAALGLNTYRFSVEWARVEPAEGSFAASELAHYRDMVDAVRENGMAPMVTLNHFTLPRWVAAAGGWRARSTPAQFARYCGRVVAALGPGVEWYCTINEPGVVAFGGYLDAFGFPPGSRSLGAWEEAITGLVEGHRRARDMVKEARPDARVGATHSMQEWEANAGGAPLLDWMRGMNEDVFLAACEADDFVGVQTYTRQRIDLPGPMRTVTAAALRSRRGRRLLARTLAAVSRRRVGPPRRAGGGPRLTQMGYEFRPEAVAATVRRAATLLPGREILVTEHGIATADDAERVEFIRHGLRALHRLIGQGVPLRGYIHWSALDNFEWARGYQMTFGLIGFDRATQERSVKPSAHVLGEIARHNALPGAD